MDAALFDTVSLSVMAVLLGVAVLFAWLGGD